jgi:hypothetical protein
MRKFLVTLAALSIGLAVSMPAHAQTVLQSRGSNVTNGPVACTGLDTTSSITFSGTSALPFLPTNIFVVGADILLQTVPTSGVQHVFVAVDASSIVPPPGTTIGNDLLATLGAGEVHNTRLFPFNSNNVTEIAGFKLANNTPTFDVTFSCSQGQFQAQVFFYFNPVLRTVRVLPHERQQVRS